MWQLSSQQSGPWDVSASNANRLMSVSESVKRAHELRILNLLLSLAIQQKPSELTNRESPDFEVVTPTGRLFVEVVEAVPDAISEMSTMNLAKRRDRSNPNTYRVDEVQFGKVIADRINDKRRLAMKWLQADQRLHDRTLLLVYGGTGPLPMQCYFHDVPTFHKYVGVTQIDPFCVVVAGDERGGFVWGDVP